MGPMESAIKGIEQATSFYNRDLDALTEEQILGSAGGCARKPVDFTYEVGELNLRVASRLRDIEPPPAKDWDGWVVAPAEMQSKAAIMEFMRNASEELLAAAKSVSEEQSGKLVGTPGREQPAFGLANFAAMHTMYHDAQLNIIQSLNGDNEMHWF